MASIASRVPRLAVTCTAAVLLLAGVPVGAASRKTPRPTAPEDLTNFLLSPAYSNWLVGPASHLASGDEIRRFLGLPGDAEAEAFIEEFWERRRSADRPWPAEQPRTIFERRVREADRQYSEGTRRGRTTDRGVIHVLYGSPQEVTYEVTADRRRLTFEIWRYPEDAPPGLDGRSPKPRYHFLEQDGSWQLHNGPPPRFRGPQPPGRLDD